MKFTCEKYLLSLAVSTAGRAAASKSPVAALEGLLLEAGESGVRITGFDLKKGIYTNFPADVSAPGNVVISARLFGEIVRKLPDGIVTVAADDYNTVNISCGNADYNVAGTPSEDYPELPSMDHGSNIVVGQETLSSMISQTSFAISTNESRPVYTGALLEVENGVMTMVAVDGYRLALRRETVDSCDVDMVRFIVPGSALSVANPNIVLNTAVAETLSQIYDELKDVSPDQIDDAVHNLLKKMLAEHKRILFNGNGYTDEWVEEAHRRGLADLKSLPDAMPSFIADKSIELFTKHGIFTREELESRYEILLENYAKTIHIESLTLQEMVRKDFTAGLVQYMKDVTNEALKKRDLLPDSRCSYEGRILQKLDETSEQILDALDALEADTKKAEAIDDILAQAAFYQKTILAEMETLRSWTDKAEAIIPDQYLPYPTYEQMLFSLR